MKPQLPRTPLILLIIGIITTQPIRSQPDWREQPKWFGIGITIGIAGGTKVNTGTLMAGAVISKAAWDLQRGASNVDPFTAGYGTFLGAATRLHIIKKRRGKTKQVRRIHRRQCPDALG
jgi:hypothetical protein